MKRSSLTNLKSVRILKDKSGAALMMALFTVMMLMLIATELMYETNVELQVSSQAINEVRAHYAAKAGMELSLLRIHIYKQAAAAAGNMVPPEMLNQIWKFPFAWPPPLPEEMSSVDKDEIKATVKESIMEGQYFATIASEGSKIDINDLASPSEAVAEATKEQILQILNSKVEEDENFARRYRGFDFGSLVNNLIDWVDANSESLNGGDESALYAERGGEFIPPNQPFKTLAELHLVEGMTDELYNVLAPKLTLYGSKGINVNFADKGVLMSLSSEITSERADQILKDREDPTRGPFKNLDDFVQYLNSIGVTGNPFVNSSNQPITPLLFDAEHNFRIRSTGQSGKITREITAIVYDTEKVKSNLKKQLEDQAKVARNPSDPNQEKPPANDQNNANQSTGQKNTPSNTNSQPPPSQRPNIVYWNET